MAKFCTKLALEKLQGKTQVKTQGPNPIQFLLTLIAPYLGGLVLEFFCAVIRPGILGAPNRNQSLRNRKRQISKANPSILDLEPPETLSIGKEGCVPTGAAVGVKILGLFFRVEVCLRLRVYGLWSRVESFKVLSRRVQG